MRRSIRAGVIAVTVVIAGCATVPGNTRANLTLQQDTSKMLLMIDRATGKERAAERKITNTEVRAEEGGIVRERWTVDRCGKPIPYDVKFVPSPQGGTDFSIESGPGGKG